MQRRRPALEAPYLQHAGARNLNYFVFDCSMALAPIFIRGSVSISIS